MTVVKTQAVDVVLPAHNEGPAIEKTLREFYETVAIKDGIQVRFIVCEDGSTDDTVEIVTKLGDELPITLISSKERKGYSKAVVDGLQMATADIVGFIDSDGQCDPGDFSSLYRSIDDADLVIGFRNPRNDLFYRKAMSAAFKAVYQRLFPVRLKDPSCPFLLVHRRSLEAILRGRPGLLRQGFWWEFNARAHAAGLTVLQLPVHHRARTDGETKVYSLRRIPSIATEHLAALVELRGELRALHQGSKPALTFGGNEAAVIDVRDAGSALSENPTPSTASPRHA